MGLLKRVSRSFYLSLRLLPGPMREGAGLAYLLARATDSIADSSAADTQLRLAALDDFAMASSAGDLSTDRLRILANGLDDPAEAELLQRAPELLRHLEALDSDQQALIQNLITTIISGQTLDLKVFGSASAARIQVFGDVEAIEDYTYRVAGCVGAFWTRLALLTVGGHCMGGDAQEQIRRAVAYGKGLQWVNILRDLPADLRLGRCYLPVVDPADREQLLRMHQRQCRHARALVEEGMNYSAVLRHGRLRTASVLPALLAIETLDRLAPAGWDQLETGVKIGRGAVYRLFAEAWFY